MNYSIVLLLINCICKKSLFSLDFVSRILYHFFSNYCCHFVRCLFFLGKFTHTESLNQISKCYPFTRESTRWYWYQWMLNYMGRTKDRGPWDACEWAMMSTGNGNIHGGWRLVKSTLCLCRVFSSRELVFCNHWCNLWVAILFPLDCNSIQSMLNVPIYRKCCRFSGLN